jgi:hypothetical protein
VTDPPLSDALRAALLALPEHVPLARLDRVWIFPPRETGGRESGLLVLALLPEEEPAPAGAPRRLLTLRYEADRGRARARPRLELAEQGSAPPDLIPRVIAGVVARLREPDEPAEHALHGSAAAWHALLERYGMRVVDRGNGE